MRDLSDNGKGRIDPVKAKSLAITHGGGYTQSQNKQDRIDEKSGDQHAASDWSDNWPNGMAKHRHNTGNKIYQPEWTLL